jgi:hypothetical protein
MLPPAPSRQRSSFIEPPPPADLPRSADPPPPDPARERRDAIWNDFESQEWDGRIAVFLRALDDVESMTDEMAFEMLNELHAEAVQHGERARFTELVDALANRLPEVYWQSALSYFSWLLEDALAEGREDVLPLARELGTVADQNIDVFNQSLRQLAYHGRLVAVLEAMRVAWPSVQSSSDVLPHGIYEFGETGARYEIYNYLERTESPDPRARDLFDRIKFFVADADPNELALRVSDLAGQAASTWTVGDFALKPVRKKRRSEWDDDEDEGEDPPDPGALNLSRLISQFIGYLRRDEGVPYPKGELVREELFAYFIRRHKRDLDPRPSMLEQAMKPGKKLPPPPAPGHPLGPERVTFEVQLAELVGFFSARYHTAAALFELVPAWLRFLESRGLIAADRHAKTLEDLRPLHANLLRLMESYKGDPALFEELRTWPAGPAKAAPATSGR